MDKIYKRMIALLCWTMGGITSGAIFTPIVFALQDTESETIAWIVLGVQIVVQTVVVVGIIVSLVRLLTTKSGT